jgi:3-phytase
MRNVTAFSNPFISLFILFISLLTAVILASHPVQATTITGVDFLGQTTFPTGTTFRNTQVGGLSGITYNPRRNVYYSISDDRSQKNPGRFYTLNINLSGNKLGAVRFTNVTTLLNDNGKPFPPLSLDAEGIAFTKRGTVFISSEGDTNKLINPFINEFTLTGRLRRKLPIPDKFLPVPSDKKRGIRNNLAFESLTITPNHKYLFTATENALLQDGEEATPTNGSPSRILQYNLRTGKAEREFLYLTDSVAAAANPPDSMNANGLVDLAALDNNHLISLERSFSLGVGNTIKLYEVVLSGATNISKIERLNAVEIKKIQPVKKELLLNLSKLNIPWDNIEGMTLGATLADKRRTLILVSDNNFNPLQTTQVLALALKFNHR